MNFTTVAATDVIPAKEIEEETKKDEMLKLVKMAVGDGRWHKIPKEIRKQFKPIQQELTVVKDGIVVRGSRIVMPEALQKRTIELAREGHQGMTKTKRHLRARVWFPKMDLMVEEAIKRCLACQVSTKTKQRAPIQP